MPKFLTLLMVTLMSFALLAPVADAKRLGGGKSFGMQRDNIGQQAAPRAPSQAQNPGAAGGAAAPAAGNRWLGPIAGLAAGGLLAAMFMGGAVAGIKPFDIVQLLGIAVLIDFGTVGSHYIASVRFYVTLRVDGAPAESFDVIWHIQRAVNGDNNWY